MTENVHGFKCSPLLLPSPLYLHRLQKKLCRLLRRLSSRPQAHWEVLSALCQLPEKEARHRGDWMSATHRPVTCVRRQNRWLTCRLNTQVLILKVRNMVSNHWCFVSVLMKHAVCSKTQQLISKDCILKMNSEEKYATLLENQICLFFKIKLYLIFKWNSLIGHYVTSKMCHMVQLWDMRFQSEQAVLLCDSALLWGE